MKKSIIPPPAPILNLAFRLLPQNPSNQGSSCLIKANAIFPNHHQFGEPTRWMGRIGRRMVKSCTQEKSSLGREETGEGERHHQSILVCATHRQSRQKTFTAPPPTPAPRILLRYWMLGVRCWMLDVSVPSKFPICVHPRPSAVNLPVRVFRVFAVHPPRNSRFDRRGGATAGRHPGSTLTGPLCLLTV